MNNSILNDRANGDERTPCLGESVESLLTQWEACCSRSPALRFVDIGLRGFGQVMFQDNSLTGLLFLAAIAWGSIVAGVPHVLLAGVLGVVASTLTAVWLNADKTALMAGLYGYNGVLVGLALATFLSQGVCAMDICCAGRGGIDRGDARDDERAQAIRGACSHRPVCWGHLDHAALDL